MQQASVAPRSLQGAVLGDRYRLERLIARGGMGDVFEAEDVRLQRRVAVKVFRSGPAADRSRFDGEVRTLASLDHPGLVRVFDAGEHDGDAYVVLELIDGPTLAARLPEGPLPPEQVADLGMALADALAYVHDRGVVHRDVTPSNVLCGPDGRPRLADFGIARLVDGTRLTASATTIGTAAYMAPEQVQGHEVTPAADVYALGLVLLELLTGRRAFEGTAHEVAVARLVRPPDTTTDVPGPWRPLLAAMTDRAAPNRPTAAAVRDRIADVMAAVDRTEDPTGAVAAAVVAEGADPPGAAGRTTTVLGDRTHVLPLGLAPEPRPAPHAAAVSALAARAWARRWLIAGVALLLIVLLASSAFGGGGVDVPSPSTVPVTSAEPVTTAPPPTTTVPPEPADQEDEGAGRGEDKGDRDRKGKGKGHDEGDEDD